MRPSMLACVFLAAASPSLSGQVTFQQRQDLSYEQRIARLEAERAALKEDMKAAKDDISELQTALKSVRDQAKSADDRSQSNSEQIATVTTIGRLIGGAVVFVLGAIMTPWISRWVSSAKTSAAKD
jgi:septal ring factor EnvC (AmiA/AmiB activator)